MENIMEYVVFKLQNEYYGVNIDNVENIERYSDITRVPYTNDYVKGIINLRGNIIPVVDLRTRFNLSNLEITGETRIMIVKAKDLNIGMVVDSSSEVIQFTMDDIDEAPRVSAGVADNFITKIGKKDGRIIMLIDLLKVLNLEELDIE